MSFQPSILEQIRTADASCGYGTIETAFAITMKDAPLAGHGGPGAVNGHVGGRQGRNGSGDNSRPAGTISAARRQDPASVVCFDSGMRRRVTIVVASISSAAALALMLVWSGSYKRILTANAQIVEGDVIGSADVKSVHGHVLLSVDTNELDNQPVSSRHSAFYCGGRSISRSGIAPYVIQYLDRCSGWSWGRFRLQAGHQANPVAGQYLWTFDLILPDWVLLGVLLIPPTVGVVKMYRVLQTDVLCVHCGYDLRVTRDRCPECGTSAGAVGKVGAKT